MVHVCGRREALRVALVQVPDVVEDVGVVDEPLLVALEVNVVHLVETHQGRENPHVRQGHSIPGQVSPR